ncbi:(2Fe-2S) ferredoxin domain-containing protein [Candidatus Peregrinibacteria bacterium]|nr:(2Fe-2S) ferredoxin domain-containing protein [Candidatus Peregrinibacteria bacterium]
MKEIKQPYEKHIFVCCNTKADGTGCAPKGGEELRNQLKKQALEKGLAKVRVNKSGCLDFCENGIAVAVYPEGKFFLDVEPGDSKLENFI